MAMCLAPGQGPHPQVCAGCIAGADALGGGNAQLVNGVREEAHAAAALGAVIAQLAAVPDQTKGHWFFLC
jgi:hypothetical protein